MLRESARLAEGPGAYWQPHLSEDWGELAEVARLFPEARDYLDVYDRAGALGPRAILAHAIHLSDREGARAAGAPGTGRSPPPCGRAPTGRGGGGCSRAPGPRPRWARSTGCAWAPWRA